MEIIQEGLCDYLHASYADSQGDLACDEIADYHGINSTYHTPGD